MEKPTFPPALLWLHLVSFHILKYHRKKPPQNFSFLPGSSPWPQVLSPYLFLSIFFPSNLPNTESRYYLPPRVLLLFEMSVYPPFVLSMTVIIFFNNCQIKHRLLKYGNNSTILKSNGSGSKSYLSYLLAMWQVTTIVSLTFLTCISRMKSPYCIVI